ncbi:GDT1-like protein 5 [Rhynchospora pubera]|uniref:GDT1 family protein n=1 Tax=Rhynchospora pubera TaxID=906938 RepID=A0AAV8C5W5_9POAL|nr:GDT1-like protein 5 [Rhynchospora pubera]
MTILSEIGDNTFFAAAILAMRHPRSHVLAGCLVSLIITTILSAALGYAAPNLVPRELTHHITTLLFFVFGIWSLWEGFTEDGDDDELAEVEAKLNADSKGKSRNKENSKDDDDLKKSKRPFLTQFFSPFFIKIATIGLAADENPFGVVLGGILGQALCTVLAVVGGKGLASHISEKIVTLASGALFIAFGVHSFLSNGDD